MTVIIGETWKTIIISLSAQLLLFIKNDYEGAINLTSLASLGCSVTAVVCSSICQLIFRTILFSNLSLHFPYFDVALKEQFEHILDKIKLLKWN